MTLVHFPASPGTVGNFASLPARIVGDEITPGTTMRGDRSLGHLGGLFSFLVSAFVVVVV